MKTFLRILLGIFVLLLITMFAMGKQYHFETSKIIAAPAEKVWPHLASMKAFNEWNPWMKLDPNMKITYSGVSGAVGDQYCWEGNDDAGKGCHTVTAMEPNRRQSTKMLFKEPFESVATSDVILTREGNSTKVTWSMDCEFDYPMNLMKFFMDGQMEKSYGSGLQKLKTLLEN